MSEGNGAKTRHPKSTTRLAILAKAYEMYLDRRLDPGDEKLSAVLAELGYTTGAGYQIWANQAAFRQDLQIYVAQNIDSAMLEIMRAKRDVVAARTYPLEQSILFSGDHFFEAFVSNDGFYLTLRFFAMGQDRSPLVTEALADAYQRSAKEIGALFSASLVGAGRRLRPPISMDELSSSITALLEGYALRHRVDPEIGGGRIEVDGEQHYVFSVAFRAVVLGMTQPA